MMLLLLVLVRGVVADWELPLVASIPAEAVDECKAFDFIMHKDLCTAASAMDWLKMANGRLHFFEAYALGAYMAAVYKPLPLVRRILGVLDGHFLEEKEHPSPHLASVVHGAIWRAVATYEHTTDNNLMGYAWELCGGPSEVKHSAFLAGICGHGIGRGVLLRKMCTVDGTCLEWNQLLNAGVSLDAVNSAESACDVSPTRDIAYECQSGVWKTYVEHVHQTFEDMGAGATSLVDLSKRMVAHCDSARYPHMCLTFVGRKIIWGNQTKQARLLEEVGCGTNTSGIVAEICGFNFDSGDEHMGRACAYAWGGLLVEQSANNCHVRGMDPNAVSHVCRGLGFRNDDDVDVVEPMGVLRSLTCILGMQKWELSSVSANVVKIRAKHPEAEAQGCHRFCNTLRQDLDPNIRAAVDLCKNRAVCYSIDAWDALPDGVWLGSAPADLLDANLELNDILRKTPLPPDVI